MKALRKHRHSEMIKQWLEDDSLEVEIFLAGKWHDVGRDYPNWSKDAEYRFKPKMITVGEHSFPEPMRVAPEAGAWVYLPNILGKCVYVDTHWLGDESDVMLLKRGLVHLTQAAAEAHARVLLSLTEIKE